MNWSKEWPSGIGKVIMDDGPNTKTNDWPSSATAVNAIWQNEQATARLASGQLWTKTIIENGEVKTEIIPLEKVYNNKMPTHDPYTNPNAIIYYACSCGAILDCNTKSFAALNKYASDKGWKIRFGQEGYTPYCVDCGKDVE